MERIFEKEIEEIPKNGDFCSIDYHQLIKKMQKKCRKIWILDDFVSLLVE